VDWYLGREWHERKVVARVVISCHKVITPYLTGNISANFTVPDVGMLFDEVQFTEVEREEAETLVEKYREEGQKNLPPPEPSQPPVKRFREGGGGGYENRDRSKTSFLICYIYTMISFLF